MSQHRFSQNLKTESNHMPFDAWRMGQSVDLHEVRDDMARRIFKRLPSLQSIEFDTEACGGKPWVWLRFGEVDSDPLDQKRLLVNVAEGPQVEHTHLAKVAAQLFENCILNRRDLLPDAPPTGGTHAVLAAEALGLPLPSGLRSAATANQRNQILQKPSGVMFGVATSHLDSSLPEGEYEFKDSLAVVMSWEDGVRKFRSFVGENAEGNGGFLPEEQISLGAGFLERQDYTVRAFQFGATELRADNAVGLEWGALVEGMKIQAKTDIEPAWGHTIREQDDLRAAKLLFGFVPKYVAVTNSRLGVNFAASDDEIALRTEVTRLLEEGHENFVMGNPKPGFFVRLLAHKNGELEYGDGLHHAGAYHDLVESFSESKSPVVVVTQEGLNWGGYTQGGDTTEGR